MAECIKKLEVLKYWNIQVSDCWFPNGKKNCKPVHWDLAEIKKFGRMCRKHNQRCRHNGIDPEKRRLK